MQFHDAPLRRAARRLALLGLLATAACKHEPKPDSTPALQSSATASSSATGEVSAPPPVASDVPSLDASAPVDAAATGSAGKADPKRYRWLAADNLKFPAAVDTLEARFPTPPGYQRVALEPGSFGEWLRGLPLAAEGTPVLNNSGDSVFSGNDDYVAAVVAIDVGPGDLQQSADAVIRLHGEWLWASDKPNAISYKSTTKLDLPFSRWAKGQRLLAAGPNMGWVVKGKPRDPTYNDFRQYIDAVMLWSNNVSLGTRSIKVEDPAQLTPGDFFLQSHGKGHAVLVLDVARKPTGERVALLGIALQSPAQSIHVMRLGRETAWFSLRPPSPVRTPRSDEFAWADLSRLEPKKDD